jgi:hypothetical protein
MFNALGQLAMDTLTAPWRRIPTVFLTNKVMWALKSDIWMKRCEKTSAINRVQLDVSPNRFSRIMSSETAQCSPAEEQRCIRSFICENLKSLKSLSIINYNGDRNELNITQNDDTYTELTQLNINICISCHLVVFKKEATFWPGPNNFQSWGFNSCRKLVFQCFIFVTKLGVTPSSMKSPNFPFILWLKK